MAKTTAKQKFEKATKLWQILGMALHDLRAIKKKRGYKVDMNYWHQPKDNKCAVCLAGSVMANRLGCNKKEEAVPQCTPYSLKLQALNSLRIFDVVNACSLMSDIPVWNTRTSLKAIRIERQFSAERTGTTFGGYIEYDDPNWWPAMRRLHKALKQADI